MAILPSQFLLLSLSLTWTVNHESSWVWREGKAQVGPSFSFSGFWACWSHPSYSPLTCLVRSHSFWHPLAFFNHNSGFSWLQVTETPIETGWSAKRVLLAHSFETSSAGTSFRYGWIQGLHDVIGVLCPHISRTTVLCVDHILRWLLLSRGQMNTYNSRLMSSQGWERRNIFFPL